MTNNTITADMIAAIRGQVEYDADAVIAGWERGDFGDLTDSETGETIRKATAEECAASLAASYEGHIDVAGRDCYVNF